MVETKGFDAQDGIGLQWLSWNNIKTGVISGRVSPATVERASQCKFSYVYQGHMRKSRSWTRFWRIPRSTLATYAYIGDDLTDIVIMRRVGLSFAPANARDEVKQAAHYTTKAPGGSGAVREVCEVILKAKGLWEPLLRKYEVIV